MYKIGDLNFEIEELALDAYLDDDDMVINWGITASGRCLKKGYERWKPKASVEILLSTAAHEITDWRELSGKEVKWEDKYDSEEEMYGALYVFEHNPVYKSKLLLTARDSGLAVSWLAKTDVNWDGKYGTNIDFEVEGLLSFKGIWCGRLSEDDSYNLAKKFIDIDKFYYQKTESGVSILVPN